MGVSLAGWRAHALSGSGAVAAWMVGTLVLWGGGWQGGAVLAAFFVSSSLVSRLTLPASGLDPKGDRRDHRQVWANGGPAALGALLGFCCGEAGLWVITGSLAAAAADTWATAIGSRSGTPPRLLWSGRIVPPGTNGGVTVLGSVGALAGALLVAATGALASGGPRLLPLATAIGFAGMLLDSTLGAVLQGRFLCPACGASSEWRVHRCGTPTVRQGGIAWLDNDGVNLAATTAAALLALAGWVLCGLPL
ncbi:MAG: DUF92 domain-containing protein [Gemmatimonadales bacterium]